MPKPTLTVLIGPSGSGKSTYAAAHWKPSQIVSSDHLREMVSDDPWDQLATTDAFVLLHQIVEMRLQRGLDTVVDATSSYAEHRAILVSIARQERAFVRAVVMATPLPMCLDRNACRSPNVPENVVVAQWERIAADLRTLGREGFGEIEFAGTGSAKAVEIEALIEASSFGTPGARKLRERGRQMAARKAESPGGKGGGR
jgi:predicted kinase